MNPIRYRGYYHDTETKLYYLQSRYYNSEWGRFISADVYTDTGDGILSTNMYAYCQNDPVNKVDPTGANYTLTMQYSSIGGSIALLEPTPFGEVIFAIGFVGVVLYDTINTVGYEVLNPSYINNLANFAASTQDAASSIQDFWQSYVSSTPPPGSNWNGGFETFNQLKNYLNRTYGKLPSGFQYHHIVEQSQIKKSGIPANTINNINNVVGIPKELHQKISAYYSSKPGGAVFGNLTVRDWLAGQSFDFQYEFGVDIINKALRGLL